MQMKDVTPVLDQRGAVTGWSLLQKSHPCIVRLGTLNDATLGNLSCQGKSSSTELYHVVANNDDRPMNSVVKLSVTYVAGNLQRINYL